MNQTFLSAITAALTLSAPVDLRNQVHAKAPVAIDATIGAGTAKINVRFQGAAQDVAIAVRGLDGLQVTNTGAPTAGATYQQGQSLSFEAAFRHGPGQSHLVVSVAGTFRVGRRSTVASFAVGKPAQAQQKSRGVLKELRGERIKIVPLDPR